MTSSVRNPLLIPEIACHLASLRPYQVRNLAYTCKSLFRLVVPVLWEEVCFVEKILCLIPGAKFEREPGTGENGQGLAKYVVLDETSVAEDWSRYWFYAPFVKRLLLFSPQALNDGSLHVRGWHFLFLKLKDGPLLPNLRALDIAALHMHSSFEKLAWFTLFISPSLRQLDWYDGLNMQKIDPQLPTHPIYFFLAALSETFPNHPRNSLFTRYERLSEHTLALPYPSEYRQGHYCFNMPDLSHLRELGVTVFPSPETIWDALCIIGCLPLLERLKLQFMINWDGEPGAGFDFDNIPPCLPTLFPSLRIFDLSGLHSNRLYRWIWGLKPMVSALSSACIEGCDSTSNPEEFNNNILQPIREASPDLTSLSIAVPDLPDTMNALEIACETLSQMRLKELELRGLKGWGPYPTIHQASIFPHLRRLRLSILLELKWWQTLVNVAKALPNLEYLYIWPLIRTFEPRDLDDANVEYTSFQSIEIEVRKPFVFNLSSTEEWHSYSQLVKKYVPNPMLFSV
ncbi:unnamed protein product [Rhizoctonia solani]|uniref:F-box domain-containing protein n=1 Tax=Rhizoctonia solani TaxID=456999 RepID=A0A8H3HSM5_9AGAM|nr:unnamed protein product [Rhizoctonia solani]